MTTLLKMKKNLFLFYKLLMTHSRSPHHSTLLHDHQSPVVHQENIEKTSFSLVEVSGDLFSSPPSHSLCHCVSRDFRLGKGVAKIFRDKFGRIEELKQSGASVTEIAVLKEGNRFIYNLVTKVVCSGKPTYDNLRQCLQKMRDHALEHSVTHISMPRIGCGLDMLSWSAVKTLIMNIFLTTDITITVYTLDDQKNPRN